MFDFHCKFFSFPRKSSRRLLPICCILRVFPVCFPLLLLFIFGCQSPDQPLPVVPTSFAPAPPPPLPLGNYRVFYGDLHNHTDISDGRGTPEEAYRYARDVGHMDFMGLSDHEWNLTENLWNYAGRVADHFTVNDTFVALRGFEWSSMSSGHVTIVGTEDFCYSEDPADSSTSTFSGLCSWLSVRDGIATFNHPGRSGIYEFDQFFPPPIDRFVGMELWNKSAGFNVYYYNDGNLRDDNNRSYFDEALNRGWRIGAGGGGDNHWATWGTATDSRMGVLANYLTREEIMDALKARRFFSTLDVNLNMSFLVDNAPMGSTVYGPTHYVELVAVDGNNELFTQATLFNGNHDTVLVWPMHTRSLHIAYTYTTTANDYLYFLIRQADGDEAISSPVWIKP